MKTTINQMPPMKPLETMNLENAMNRLRVEHERLFVHDEEHNTITLHIDYPYEIDLDMLDNKQHLLQWVLHLSSKVWMEAKHINIFIRRVAEIKGWRIYS